RAGRAARSFAADLPPIEPDRDHAIAAAGQFAGDGAADAVGTTGDDHDLAGFHDALLEEDSEVLGEENILVEDDLTVPQQESPAPRVGADEQILALAGEQVN